MSKVHYSVSVHSSITLGSFSMRYQFDTWEEVLKKVESESKLKSTVKIEVTEYRLVYDHKNPLPKADGYNEFFEEFVYNKKYVNENPVIAKVKDYKDNIQNYSDTFKIKYIALDERSELEYTDKPMKYFKEVNCTYSAKSLKEAKEMLRSHTRSKSFFNIRMYQCREIPISVEKLLKMK